MKTTKENPSAIKFYLGFTQIRELRKDLLKIICSTYINQLPKKEKIFVKKFFGTHNYDSKIDILNLPVRLTSEKIKVISNNEIHPFKLNIIYAEEKLLKKIFKDFDAKFGGTVRSYIESNKKFLEDQKSFDMVLSILYIRPSSFQEVIKGYLSLLATIDHELVHIIQFLGLGASGRGKKIKKEKYETEYPNVPIEQKAYVEDARSIIDVFFHNVFQEAKPDKDAFKDLLVDLMKAADDIGMNEQYRKKFLKDAIRLIKLRKFTKKQLTFLRQSGFNFL